MTTVAGDAQPATRAPRPLWKRFVIALLLLVIGGALANLLGWDIKSWFQSLWDTMTSISVASLLGAIGCMIVQTTATAFAWYSILHYAYPDRPIWRDVLAGYAVSVALNGILPANLGTLALLLMFTTVIAGATFAAILGAYAVEKIFFTVIGAFTYLYLFLSVGGSFDIKFGFVHAHPWGTAILLLGGCYLVYLVARRLWPRVLKWWDEAKEGGAILAQPGKYMTRVFTPSLLGWIASLGVMAVFLTAYDIPVTFHTLMRIAGGNSIANVTSATPGGAGVNQAFNVASLKGVASSDQAAAYSVAQQLVTTAWNIVFGIILMTWAFGWSGGKQLVGESYEGAKAKAAEQKAARDARKEAKRAAKAEQGEA